MHRSPGSLGDAIAFAAWRTAVDRLTAHAQPTPQRYLIEFRDFGPAAVPWCALPVVRLSMSFRRIEQSPRG
jgi:hypothetical protein